MPRLYYLESRRQNVNDQKAGARFLPGLRHWQKTVSGTPERAFLAYFQPGQPWERPFPLQIDSLAIA